MYRQTHKANDYGQFGFQTSPEIKQFSCHVPRREEVSKIVSIRRRDQPLRQQLKSVLPFSIVQALFVCKVYRIVVHYIQLKQI